MAKITFLTLEQVLAIHFDQVNRYGGSHGVRDFPLLESAVQRPQSSFMGQDLYETLFDKAALFHSLVLNHPFIDANKRTSTVSTAGFLHLNGYDLKVSLEELEEASLKIESKKWDLEEISKWLKEHSIKASK
jgi:death on curing protein